MTQAIKQWIADQALEIATTRGFAYSPVVNEKKQLGAISGLTKGIEIAEGFAVWANEGFYLSDPDTWLERSPLEEHKRASFTTSQLLEKYLKTLEP